MKPFNLEEAKAGAKIVTSRRIEVKEWAYFLSALPAYRIVAVVNGIPCFFTTEGRGTPGSQRVDLYLDTDIP